MSRNHAILISAALLLGGNAIAARFQQAKPADKPAAKQRTLQITGVGLVHSDATGLGEAKDVELVDGDTILKGDSAKWNMKTETAETIGHLLMTDPRADATGDKAEIQFGKSKRFVVLTGGVKITVKPKSEENAPAAPNQPMPVEVKNGKAVAGENAGKEDDSVRKHPAVVTCDKAEYWYSKTKKYAILSGSFKVVQTLTDKTRTVTAHHAEWFGKEDKLVLHAPVHFEDTKGQKGDPVGDVVVYTAEGNEKLEVPGKVILQIKLDEDEDEEAAPPSDKTNKKKPN